MYFSASTIGVFVSIVGNLLISVALNLQKYVHNSILSSLETRSLLTSTSISSKNDTLSYLNYPVWWLGLLVLAVGELGNFIAYGYASAILIAPLGTVALISNALIAPFFLGEFSRVQDFIGIGFAAIGTVGIIIVKNI